MPHSRGNEASQQYKEKRNFANVFVYNHKLAKAGSYRKIYIYSLVVRNLRMVKGAAVLILTRKIIG